MDMSTEKYKPAEEEVKKAEEMIEGDFEKVLSENRQDAMRTGFVYLGRSDLRSRWIQFNKDGKLRLYEGGFVHDPAAEGIDAGRVGFEVELGDVSEEIDMNIDKMRFQIQHIQAKIEMLRAQKDVIEFDKTKIQ